MKSKIIWIICIVLMVVLVKQVWPIVVARWPRPESPGPKFDYVRPHYGDIDQKIVANAIVQPQNRVEIIAPMNGRVEEIRVQEGDIVKKGDVLALISSVERAAILDATTTNGKHSPEYWQKVFKPTALTAPVDGTVIVRSAEAGQNVNTTKPVLVLSNRLIVSAQVDESEITSLQTGQVAHIKLDAFPEQIISAKIGIISHEAVSTNNITVYNVQILPEVVPNYLRSGMSAEVEIVTLEKKNVLLIPIEAVSVTDAGPVVYTTPENPSMANIKIGLKNAAWYEVTSGVTDKDTLLIKRP